LQKNSIMNEKIKPIISTPKFAITLTILFSIVAGIGMHRHEMWRDELEIFMKVTANISLFKISYYSSIVYYSFLKVILNLFPHPAIAYQICHLLFITMAVFIFNRYSPFSYLQKALFTFSYFILFEYGIISRAYSFTVLLMFIAIYLITRKKQNYILIAIVLLVLANHRLFGLFASISLAVYALLHIVNKFKSKTFYPGQRRQFFIALGLFIVGWGLISAQYYILKFTGPGFTTAGPAPYYMTIRTIWNAFVPIPEITNYHFWNTNIIPFPLGYPKNIDFEIEYKNIVTAIISVGIFIISIVMFSKKIPVLITFTLHTLLQLLFLQYVSVHFTRYQGYLFIIFMYNCWLLYHSDETVHFSLMNPIVRFLNKPFLVSIRRPAVHFVTFFLLFQFAAGVFAYYKDIKHPFTASYNAAEFIRANGLEEHIIVGYIDYIVQPIAALLNREIYYPQIDGFGTYVDWGNASRYKPCTTNKVLDSAVQLLCERNKNVLLILSSRLLRNNKPVERHLVTEGIEIRKIGEFRETIVGNEKYFMYEVYSPR
jgi:hypothetical protein